MLLLLLQALCGGVVKADPSFTVTGGLGSPLINELTTLKVMAGLNNGLFAVGDCFKIVMPFQYTDSKSVF